VGDKSNFAFRQKLLGEDGSVRRGVVMVKQPKLGAMSSHFFTQSPQNFAVEPGIHSSAYWDKFFVHNPLDVKESDDHALEISFHLSSLFWPWRRGTFPLGGLSLCLRVVTVNQALITSDDLRQKRFIVGGELTKFSADVDALMLLVSCQVPGHKFGYDMVDAQFFRQNPLTCPITQQCLEYSDVDPDR